LIKAGRQTLYRPVYSDEAAVKKFAGGARYWPDISLRIPMILNTSHRTLLNKYTGPYRSRISAITALAALCAFFEMFNLGALMPLLQLVNGTENPGGILWGIMQYFTGLIGIHLDVTSLPLIITVIFVVGQILFYFKRRMQVRMWFTFSSDLKERLFSGVMQTDISYHHSRKAGDLIDLIARQSENGANVAYTITEIYTNVLFILIYLSILLYTNVEMTIICISIALITMYWLNNYIRISGKFGTVAVETNMRMNAFINERLNLLKLIRIFSTEKSEEERFATIRRSYVNAQTNLWLNGIRIEAIFQIIIFAIALILLYVATMQFGVSLPIITVFIFTLIRLTDPLRQFNSQRNVLANQIASLAKVDEVLESLHTHTTITDGSKPFPGLKDSIEVRDVAFSYDGQCQVLSGIYFTVRKNEMLALVGVSGGGKSTIVDLLIRLIEPGRGQIVIDGKDIRTYSIESYHRRIGFVSQDSYLFDDTILNNICYGSSTRSEDQVIESAKRAHAHDFIMNLPDGYDTVIGEKGVKLSGGQKQRLSLARALYKKPYPG
jgi:ABC-type multidrug transport system fused ATPase/permease subunit